MKQNKELTILVVDDEEISRYTAVRLLRQAGYRVTEALNGREALVHAQEQPNLVLLDVHLPDMLGFEVCWKLKTNPETAAVPVLLYSATFIDDNHVIQGIEEFGADAYMAEPAEPGVLLATIKAMLRSQQAEEALRTARDELEARVVERTAELAASNEKLQREISERKQAEETAHRQAARAEALAQAAARLNARLDLEAVLETVCRLAADALAVSVVLVYLYDEETSGYQLASGLGIADESRSLIQQLPELLAERDPAGAGSFTWLNSLAEQDDGFDHQFVQALQVKRAILVDMVREAERVGCLVVFQKEEEPALAGEAISLLQGLADQAAQAILNASLYQEVQARRTQLQRLSRLIMKTSEEERKRLSRELHDSTGQVASALLLNLALISQELPAEGGHLVETFEEARTLARKIYDEIRAVSHTLRPPELEAVGLNGALEELCQEFGRFTHKSVIYHGASLPPLPDTIAIAFYRVVQEALTNAGKHADASQIHVRVIYRPEHLQVIVEDDGIGFDLNSPITTGIGGSGVGLMSMRERLHMLGGELKIYSAPGQGTKLVASCNPAEA
jgi:signal transduction histidine kinase